MLAIDIVEPGGPEVLLPTTVPVPKPGDDDVLIRVAAAAFNSPDRMHRSGLYPEPADADPRPGLEVAGTVVECGSTVSGFSVGDRVMALTHGGGYAEYCRANKGHCLAVPETLQLTAAACVPETFFTVWYNVFMRSGLKPGEVFLVHGGSSGIGSTAIQLARANDCLVITTAGSDDKCRFCESLGADLAINYRESDWPDAARSWLGPRGIDVILDMVAGAYVQPELELLGRDGRLAIIAFLGGTKAEVDLRAIALKRLTISGSTLRPQTDAEKTQIASALREHVLPMLADGRVAPAIHGTFPLERAADAHALMESSQHMGKIVLTTRFSENAC